jgi:uncharacterized membrane protein YdbT with pleckstrin-like domain
MEDTVIRPTMKFIKVGYAIVLLVVVGAVILAATVLTGSVYQYWVMGLPSLLLIWPIRRHLRRQVTKATIAGDKLRFEVGFLSKSTRNISLPKVQDVRVDQSVRQRMFSVGDVAIETAGEASRLTLRNIDQPQQIAEQILAASHSTLGHGAV